MGRLLSYINKHAQLSPDAAAAFECSPARYVTFSRRAPLVEPGDTPSYALFIHSGHAVAQAIHRNGDRSISSIYMPGDILHLAAGTPHPLGYGIEALTRVEASLVEHSHLNVLASRHPSFCEAIRAVQLQEEARLRFSFFSIARGDAYDRLNSLLLSLWQRGIDSDLVDNGQMALPLTQIDLSDALGLTSVHLNRVLQRVRKNGLASLENGTLSIPDPAALAASIRSDVSARQSTVVQISTKPTPKQHASMLQPV